MRIKNTPPSKRVAALSAAVSFVILPSRRPLSVSKKPVCRCNARVCLCLPPATL